MNEQDLEKLSQFLDGELAPQEARLLRERLLAEPELRATLDRMKTVNQRVVNAFGPETGKVPPRVVRLLRSPGQGQRRVGWGFALAASLLAGAGLLLSSQYAQFAGSGASHADPLAAALEASPSSAGAWTELADGRRFQAVLSFASDDGAWCREYLVAGAATTLRGVACRRSGEWATMAEETDNGRHSQSEYRPAGSSQAGTVTHYISRHAADIPLSRQQEAGLIANGWQ